MINKIIIHDNKTCQILLEDQQLLNLLRSTFSYKESGVEYSPAYKNGWSGITYLISKKGMFFSGLLDQVSSFLKDRKIYFELEDLRTPITVNNPIDLSEKLIKLGLVPRDYQTKTVDACFNNRKGIVRSCTSSGKTVTMALLTAKLNKPTIIYVIGLDLLKQTHDLFTELFDEKIGYLGDGVCDIQRINIATIWTIGSALKIKKQDIVSEDNGTEKFTESQSSKILALLKDTKVHIFDESQQIVCSTIAHIKKQ